MGGQIGLLIHRVWLIIFGNANNKNIVNHFSFLAGLSDMEFAIVRRFTISLIVCGFIATSVQADAYHEHQYDELMHENCDVIWPVLWEDFLSGKRDAAATIVMMIRLRGLRIPVEDEQYEENYWHYVSWFIFHAQNTSDQVAPLVLLTLEELFSVDRILQAEFEAMDGCESDQLPTSFCASSLERRGLIPSLEELTSRIEQDVRLGAVAYCPSDL